MTLAALKITAASGGTALAGLLIGAGPISMLSIAGAAVVLVALISMVDRRFGPA